MATYYKFTPGSEAELSLNAATAVGAGKSKAFNDCRQTNWLVEGSGTISSGTVVIESAHAHDYAGTWNEIDSVDASTLSGNKLYGNTFPHVPGGFVRGRISAEIQGGGSITVRLNGLLG
jgi:hypothetical protein